MNKKISLTLLIIIVGITVASLIYFNFENFKLSKKELQKEELKKVTLVLLYVPSTDFVPFYCALDQGYYKDEGLDITVVHSGKGAMEPIKQLGANKAEFGFTMGSSLIVARSSEDVPVVTVYQIGKNNPSVIIALKESGITSPADLIGKNVAITGAGSGSHIAAKVVLFKAGINYEKVNFIPVGEAILPVLLQKKADAITAHIQQIYLLKSMGKGEEINVIYVRDYANMVADSIIASEKIIKEQPELVKKFVAATDKGFRFAINNPERAIDIYIKNWVPEAAEERDFHLGFWKELVNECYQPDKYLPGQIIKEQWSATQDILYDTNVISKKVDLNKIYTTEFIPK